MLEVLSDARLEGSFVEAVTAAAILVHGAPFGRELAVDPRLVVGTQTEGALLELGDVGELIPVDVDEATAGVLPEDHDGSASIFTDEARIVARHRHGRGIAMARLLVAGDALLERGGAA